MSLELEGEISRVYTIPLGKAWIAPRQRRAVRVIHMIQEFARKHMKSEEVKISSEVNEYVWRRGSKSPPRRIKVRITKSENGVLSVSFPKEESVEVTPAESTEEKAEGKEVVETADVKSGEEKAEGKEVVETADVKSGEEKAIDETSIQDEVDIKDTKN